MHALIWILCVMFVTPAFAQVHENHEQHHPAYSKWMQPNKTVSCCNARVYNAEGDWTGDCYATEFRPVVREGQLLGFEALLDPRTNDGRREFVPLPEGKRIREKNPDQSGVTGHICEDQFHAILCWVPPTGAI